LERVYRSVLKDTYHKPQVDYASVL
jgi:hypothetical protein